MTPGDPAPLWEGVAPAVWQAQWGLPDLEIHDVITSTSDRARERALAGAPAGTVIMAEHQTAGRGQQRRVWHDLPGGSLLLSVLLRPAAAGPGIDFAPGTAPLRVGLALARALAAHAGIECQLKWPNDLLVPARGKVAGILCEAVTVGSSTCIIAGIGINVRQRDDDWPPELRRTATSVEACTGGRVDRAALAGGVIEALRPLLVSPMTPLSAAELAEFRRRDALRGRDIILDRQTATVRGVDADGTLIVEADGGMQRVTAATLRLAATAGADRD